MYNLNFELTKEDFKNFGKDIFSIPRFRNDYIIKAVLPAAIIFIIFLFLINNWIFNIAYTVFFAVLLITMFFSAHNYGNTLYKANKTTSMIRKMNISEEGVFVDTETSTANNSWSNFCEVYNKRNTIFLFQSKIIAIMIPKRVFESEDAANEFYEFVKQHVKQQ